MRRRGMLLLMILLLLLGGCVFTIGMTRPPQFPRDDDCHLYRPDGDPRVPPHCRQE
jgi:hypothetical protein